MFYNAAMALDRDLSVAFVTAAFAGAPHGRRAWEMLAATGARGLRIAHETGRFDDFLLTERVTDALRVARANAAALGVPGVRVEAADATRPVESAAFDYVDLDPFGSPAPFLPAALAAVRPGGVVAVTATDMMVLAGVQKGAAERRYGAIPVRGRLGPEGGLRLLLGFVAREAARRGSAVRPLLCYVHDHHVRLYVRLGPPGPTDGPAPVAEIDPATWTGPELGLCGRAGPFWLGPLFDPDLTDRLVPPAAPARPRDVARILARFREEARVPAPFYYETNRLAGALGLPAPPSPDALVAALRAAGHAAARTHAREGAFRTVAPRAVVNALARSLGAGAQSQNDRVRA